MKTVCIVQARMGSKRLPGKVLLPLNGHTVIGEVLTRCRAIPGVDLVVCAIPTGAENYPLGVALRELGVNFCILAGDQNDVLRRYVKAASLYGAKVIVRITGDCPLISPELCGEVISARASAEADYASNIEPRTFPKGLDCEVFTRRALNLADGWSAAADREHVTPWLRRTDMVRRVNVRSPWPIDGRLCLDTDDDYRVICAHFGHEPYDSAKRLRAA